MKSDFAFLRCLNVISAAILNFGSLSKCHKSRLSVNKQVNLTNDAF